MTWVPSPLVDLILRRRSVREGYLDQEVPREVLERVVACGLSGPSSKGSSPVRLTVVTGAPRLTRLARLVANAPGWQEYVPHDPATGKPRPEWQSSVQESAAVLASAPAAIFVVNGGPFSGGRRALLDAEPAARELAITGYELELAGLGAALENLWLAALADGLSAAFLGDIGVAEISLRKELGLEGDLLGVLVLGYAEPRDVRPAQEPDRSAVRWNP
jgi:nitroreductase